MASLTRPSSFPVVIHVKWIDYLRPGYAEKPTVPFDERSELTIHHQAWHRASCRTEIRDSIDHHHNTE